MYMSNGETVELDKRDFPAKADSAEPALLEDSVEPKLLPGTNVADAV